MLQKYAFFYVVNIPGFDPKAELEAIKGFFEQPLEVKKKSASKKHAPDNPNILRGYFTVQNTVQLYQRLFYRTEYSTTIPESFHDLLLLPHNLSDHELRFKITYSRTGYGYTTNIEGSPIEEVFNVGQYETREVKKNQFSSTAEFISR